MADMLHLIPDDLSIPEFLKRKMPVRRPRGAPTWSDLDNIWGDALTEAAKEYLEKRER